MDYDFTTLSPDDFEALAADLLSREWDVRLEIFKRGKDRGIDLRNTRILDGKQTTIVQCKRYAAHKFNELLRSVKLEKTKIDLLSPARYVLFTSVALSAGNKDDLMAALHPWCKSTGDIYGIGEVNGLLRDHPTVEQAHFKLWIASTAVLERLLHSRIFNVTHATVEATKAYLSRIVIHDGFNRALNMLHEEHHVLIVGNPGIGKTTLARILLSHYLKDGFEPVCVTGNIDDAWDMVFDPGGAQRKMVVLYDDFLGRLRFDSERFGKNEEHSLLDFLDKVRRSPNLRFILTTREYILADARRVHGAFASRANEILKCTLTLNDYTKAHRARMLFNHLYFSDLPDERLMRLVKDRVYKTIVEHAHFNPRIVETISNHANSRAMSDDEYLGFIQRKFDNPSEIWELPFLYDISPTARHILAVLWTFNGTAEFEMLKAAVRQLVQSEDIADFSLRFTDGIRQLDGNFISTNRYPGKSSKEGHYLVTQFNNPSVEEFVDGFLKADVSWIEMLTTSIVSFRQVNVLFDSPRKWGIRVLHPSYWMALRDAAARVEAIHGGYLVNFRPLREAVRQTWDTGDVDPPRQTLLRLQIELQVRLPDEFFLNLQKRVLTSDGWGSLIRGLQHDNSHAYGLKLLHEWVRQQSGWSSGQKGTCHQMFRTATLAIIEDEDEIWACSIGSLRTLAEIITSDMTFLTDREKAAFLEAGKLAAGTIMDNDDDPDSVRDESTELSQLEQICGVSFAEEISDLEAQADELGKKTSYEDTYDPESNYRSRSGDEAPLDMDFLFAGLLDR